MLVQGFASSNLILVVDDDPLFRNQIAKILQRKGYRVHTAADGRRAIVSARQQLPDVALVHMKLPDLNGLELMMELRSLDPHLEVVIFTDYASVDTQVEAMQSGAFDYLSKPFSASEVEVVCEKACRKRRLELRDQALRRVIPASGGPQGLIGKSSAIERVRQVIDQVAESNVTVLIEGESGTGKELVARALHRASNRRRDRFVAVNCGAIPEALLESELFGFSKGAFTGAVHDRQGLLEAARNGTLFLDEIGEMDQAVQAKILRVLDGAEYYRLGSTKGTRVDVRVVAATSKCLRREVEEGRFREDLFYRLNVIHIALPPLRERKEDIPLLVEGLMKTHGLNGFGEISISDDAWEVLWHYDWPGNVRELYNVLRTATLLCKDHTITAAECRRYAQ